MGGGHGISLSTKAIAVLWPRETTWLAGSLRVNNFTELTSNRTGGKTSMKTKNAVIWSSMGVFAVLLFSEAASADPHRWGYRDRGAAEIRRDWGEIRKDRAEVRKDFRELQRDRAELRRDLRQGAPRSEIAQDRAEIRRDWRELSRDRRELRQDYAELNRDLYSNGWYRHSDGGWYRHPPYRSSWWDRYGYWPWYNW